MIKFRFLMTVLQGSRCADEIASRHRRPGPSVTVTGHSSQRLGSAPGAVREAQPFKESLGRPGSLCELWRLFKFIQSDIKSEIGSFLKQEFTSKWVPPFNQPNGRLLP